MTTKTQIIPKTQQVVTVTLSRTEQIIIALILGGIGIYIATIGIENEQLQGQFLFGLGVFLQCFFIIMSDLRGSLKKLLVALGTGLFGFMPGKNEKHYTFGSHLFMSYVFFIFVFTGYFSKKILTKISETNLFMFLIVSLTLFLYNFSHFYIVLQVILSLFFFVSLVGVIVSFFTKSNSERMKAVFYSIYSFLVIFLCFFQFSSSNFSLFFGTYIPGTLSPLEIFTGGMLLCYAGLYITYFIRLIPLRTKYETVPQFKERIIQYRANLISSFSGNQITPIDIVALLLIVLSTLWVNFTYLHFSDGLMIALFFLLSSVISLFEKDETNESNIEVQQKRTRVRAE